MFVALFVERTEHGITSHLRIYHACALSFWNRLPDCYGAHPTPSETIEMWVLLPFASHTTYLYPYKKFPPTAAVLVDSSALLLEDSLASVCVLWCVCTLNELHKMHPHLRKPIAKQDPTISSQLFTRMRREFLLMRAVV